MNAFRVLVASVLLLLAVVVVAIVDHELKADAMASGHRDQWFCEHRGTRCGGDSPEAIEASWQTRERAYEATFGVLAFVVAGAAVRWRVSPARR